MRASVRAASTSHMNRKRVFNLLRNNDVSFTNTCPGQGVEKPIKPVIPAKAGVTGS
jgi:hypothetical protein